MKLNIKITKEVLERSQYCSVLKENLPPGVKFDSNVQKEVVKHCGIAIAVRDIFPFALVCSNDITIPHPDFLLDVNKQFTILLPKIARDFIIQFDNLCGSAGSIGSYDRRVHMNEIDFNVEVPDALIELIGIEDYHTNVTESKSLAFVDES